MNVREAFDRHATAYDERFSRRAIAQEIREDVWRIADLAFSKSNRILDLGCGTGEDALHFASQGKQVTAVDLAPQMILRLTEKAERAGLASRIQGTVSAMGQFVPAAAFDGLISNFGALNCLADLDWMRSFAEQTLEPGSPVVLTTMGRWYPLETLVFLLKGEFASLFRRFRRPSVVTVEGVCFNVYYHSLRAMKRMLEPDFVLERTAGLRAFLPVPGFEHLQRFRIFRWLQPIDRKFCTSPWTASCADHFVTLWRYRPDMSRRS